MIAVCLSLIAAFVAFHEFELRSLRKKLDLINLGLSEIEKLLKDRSQKYPNNYSATREL